MTSHLTDRLLGQLIDLQKRANDQREEILQRLGEIEMGLFAVIKDMPGENTQRYVTTILEQVVGHPEAFK